jgi:hypothetical protein
VAMKISLGTFAALLITGSMFLQPARHAGASPSRPGLSPRSVIAKFAAVQMIDLHVPTTDGRELILTRYTEPEPELALLLDKLKLELPAQPSPGSPPAKSAQNPPCSARPSGSQSCYLRYLAHQNAANGLSQARATVRSRGALLVG